MKKILFIVPTTKVGGIETYLIRFLENKGNIITSKVLVRSSIKGFLHDRYEKKANEIIYLPLGYFNLIKLVKFYFILKSNKFDTICDFNGNFSGLTMLIARLAKIKNRITFYRQGQNHFNPNFLKNLYNKFSNLLVYNFSTSILFNSYSGINFFFKSKSNDSRFKVIYNGIDSSKFNIEINKELFKYENKIPKSKFIVMHTGRLDRSKNHPIILKIAENIQTLDNSIHFILIGENVEKLESILIEKNITNVELIGFSDKISQFLNCADLFIFPSLTEGQPNSLIEALISGLPIVASNISPIKETIPINFHEYLFEHNDYLSIVNKIIKIKENHIYIKESFKECQDWAIKQYNPNIQFNNFLIQLTN